MTTINRQFTTLDEFTIKQYRSIPSATGELSTLLRDIGLAAKRINAEVSKAGLVDILGNAGTVNIQGEEVKKLDVYANTQMIGVLRHGISCAGIVSEEMDDMVVFDDEMSNNSKYVLMFDPLDGSANTDTNISIGTIFGVYKRITKPGTPCEIKDFLQPGSRQVAAGYIIYGSSTMFVYATRRGVNGFTLDPSIGEFCLSHPDIICQEDGNIYSINQANFFSYNKGIQDYILKCQHKNEIKNDTYTARYTGSMVADFHRTLIKGGIFIYAGTHKKPAGKLRLMYECNPCAFIMEVAGGRSGNGKKGQRILDLQPLNFHERTPFITGSKNMVNECLDCLLSSKKVGKVY
jgi:fructose-1,6-bisphosphatase I